MLFSTIWEVAGLAGMLGLHEVVELGCSEFNKCSIPARPESNLVMHIALGRGGVLFR